MVITGFSHNGTTNKKALKGSVRFHQYLLQSKWQKVVNVRSPLLQGPTSVG